VQLALYSRKYTIQCIECVCNLGRAGVSPLTATQAKELVAAVVGH